MNLLDRLFTAEIKSTSSAGRSTIEDVDAMERYYDAIKAHPFVHRGNYHTCIRNISPPASNNNDTTNDKNNKKKTKQNNNDQDAAAPNPNPNTNENNKKPFASHVKDSNGNTVCILLRNAFPEKVTDLASSVLIDAANRTSLRASIFGGESPFSGIAGYYDYFGSPIEYKCRKTSFTCDAIERWPRVFPLVDYASKLYEKVCPDAFAEQNEAIPDAVRIHGSPFSTLTINQRFRTAMHTDAGDFDNGFGLISVLNGEFDGCHLGFPYFGVCVEMRVGDLIFFETHHCHANTELELLPTKSGTLPWSRLSCVFYYRAVLGEDTCKREYKRRLTNHEEEQNKNNKKKNNNNSNNNNDQDNTTNNKKADEDLDMERNSEVFDRLVKEGIPKNVNGKNLNRPAIVSSTGLPTPFNMPLLHRGSDSSTSLDKLQRLQKLFDENKQEILRLGEIQAFNPLGTKSNETNTTSSKNNNNEENFAQNAVNLYLHLFNELPRSPILFSEDTSDLSRFRPHSVNFGLFPRSSISFRPVDVSRESAGVAVSALGAPKLGGFSQTDSLQNHIKSEESIQVFADESLRLLITEELLEMWTKSKASWLGKVARDWKQIKDRRGDDEDERTFKFNWKNTGDMNKAFFDLCDVASEVMLGMIQREEATPQEQNRFWAAFAYHLFRECQAVNEMPETAMTMMKLNVKLKDYNFGGTRYFKDQSAEEQARRLERKRKIAEARRIRGGGGKSSLSKNKKKKKISGKRRKRANSDSDDDSFASTTTTSSDDSDDSSSSDEEDEETKRKRKELQEQSWLANDEFDYQTEDVKILYDASKGLPTPDENAQRFNFLFGEGKKVVEGEENDDASSKKKQKSKTNSSTTEKAEEKSIDILLVVGNKNSSSKQLPSKKLLTTFSKVLNKHQNEVTQEYNDMMKTKPVLESNNTTTAGNKKKPTKQKKNANDDDDEVPQEQEEENNNNTNTIIPFSSWSRQIRQNICSMIETIRVLFCPSIVHTFDFLPLVDNDEDDEPKSGNRRALIQRQIFDQFLPTVETVYEELKNDALYLYEHGENVISSSPNSGEDDALQLGVGYSQRGKRSVAAPKKTSSTTTAAKKKRKIESSSSSEEEDDSSSSSDDDETSSSSSGTTTEDSDDDMNLLLDKAPKNTNKRKKQQKQSKRTSSSSSKKPSAKKATTETKKPSAATEARALAAKKKQEEEFKQKAYNHLVSKARHVFMCYNELVSTIQNDIDLKMKNDQQQEQKEHQPTSSSCIFKLAQDFTVNVRMKTSQEIITLQQEQESNLSSKHQFDLIVVDTMFKSLFPSTVCEEKEEEKKNQSDDDDDEAQLLGIDNKNKTKNTKQEKQPSSSIVYTHEQEVQLLQALKNLSTSSQILWIAPVLSQDTFHFMLNDRVREGFLKSGLPRYGPILHHLCHPRSFVFDKQIENNNIENEIDIKLDLEDLASQTNVVEFLNSTTTTTTTTSEFNIPMSDCQRKVYCVKI